MKWKWILLLSSLILCAITAHAGVYEDCVLKGMKGVSSDAGARLVAEACRNKVNEAKRTKRESFGSTLNESEWKLVGNNNIIHGGGYISKRLRNTSSSMTLTYIVLTIKDGDYHDYKETGKGIDNWGIDWDRHKWEGERTHTYFYKIFLRPGKEISLMFPEPRTNSFSSEITTALGRAAKWTDAVSTISLSDTIKPEPIDPLE
ncbi:MAG: hypothetical protein Q7U03_09365 [Syntrophales bacterium]|nr:hypothetical protein [Syntrophales bacterium]